MITILQFMQEMNRTEQKPTKSFKPNLFCVLKKIKILNNRIHGNKKIQPRIV